MAWTSVAVLKGSEVYIGTGGADPSNISTGGTKIGNVRNISLDVGGMASVSEEDYIDQTDLDILKVNTQDYGSVELTIAESNDSGLTSLKTAQAHATNAYPFYLKKGSVTLSFTGLVLSARRTGGTSSDRINITSRIRLTKTIS